jgi:hypothetical protein
VEKETKYLNESGEGMEEEQPHKSQANDNCEDGSQGTGRADTSKTYLLSRTLLLLFLL